MFAIPLDMIATRATDTLYTATREEQTDAGDTDQDADDDRDGAPMEDSPESAEPIVPVNVEAMTDPEDTMPVSYLHILANAQ
jgi:hypothetical protein